MSELLRKLRGALGTAVTWGAGWGVVGFLVISVLLIVFGGSGSFWESALPISLFSAFSGFVGGAAFSLALGTVHRRRRLSELDPRRMALWGAAAAMLFPIGLLGFGILKGLPIPGDVVAGMAAGLAALGGATAGGTVKLAQVADRRLAAPQDEGRLASGE